MNDLIGKLEVVGMIVHTKNKNTRIYTKLAHLHIELVQQVVEATMFLKYSASIQHRIKFIMLGITEQPLCVHCNGILKMNTRLEVKTYCSNKCIAQTLNTKNKRRDTCYERYGCYNNFEVQNDRLKYDK